MASELRKTILNAPDIKSEIVEVPEWGVKVEVRGLTGKTRSMLLANASNTGGGVNFEKWFPDLLIATLYDPETDAQVFEPADRDQINAKSGLVINRLAEIASRLSGLAEADVATAKETFEEAQSDDSISS